MSAKKYVVSFLVLLSMGWVVYMLYPSYSEYNKTRKELRDLDKSLLKHQKANENLLKVNHKLKSDPRMIERVAREKFGWSKAGEKIYDFSNLKRHETRNN